MTSAREEDGETVNVSQKGQATIPQQFRESFDISAPGKVRFSVNEDGELVVEPVTSITDFRGAGSASADAETLVAEAREPDRDRERRLLDEGG